MLTMLPNRAPQSPPPHTISFSSSFLPSSLHLFFIVFLLSSYFQKKEYSFLFFFSLFSLFPSFFSLSLPLPLYRLPSFLSPPLSASPPPPLCTPIIPWESSSLTRCDGLIDLDWLSFSVNSIQPKLDKFCPERRARLDQTTRSYYSYYCHVYGVLTTAIHPVTISWVYDLYLSRSLSQQTILAHQNSSWNRAHSRDLSGTVCLFSALWGFTHRHINRRILGLSFCPAVSYSSAFFMVPVFPLKLLSVCFKLRVDCLLLWVICLRLLITASCI